MCHILDSESISATVYKESSNMSPIGVTALFQRVVPEPDLAGGKHDFYCAPGYPAVVTVERDRWNSARGLEPGPAISHPACRSARPQFETTARTIHAGYAEVTTHYG